MAGYPYFVFTAEFCLWMRWRISFKFHQSNFHFDHDARVAVHLFTTKLMFVKFYKFLSLKIAHLIVPHVVLFLMIGALIYSVDLGLMKIYDQIRDVVPSFFVVFIVGIVSLLLWFYPILYIIKMNGKRTTLKLWFKVVLLMLIGIFLSFLP